jgi:hypothetical protein
MDPVEEYLSTKQAEGPQEHGWGPALRNAGIHAGATVAAAALPVAASKIYNAVTKSHHFNNMLANDEELQEHHAQDPKRFNLMFNALHKMNPEFASDPLIASAYMKKMLGNTQAPGLVAAEARGQVKELPQSSISKAFTSAGPGIGNALSAGARQVDPLAAQAERVKALELMQKEKNLKESLGTP